MYSSHIFYVAIFVVQEIANACIVRPCQRPVRQNEAKNTAKPLWRAIMQKLRRAGMVSTNALLGQRPFLPPPKPIPVNEFWRFATVDKHTGYRNLCTTKMERLFITCHLAQDTIPLCG